MAILGTNLDYTDKDFDSLLARARALIASVFPSWTAQSVADFGNLLVELYCFKLDVLGKYQDNQAREARWAFATQRKNLIALAKLIGYEAPTATASQVPVVIAIPDIMPGNVPIPAGTIVRTKGENPIVFRTTSLVTILAGTQSIPATAENSEAQEDTFASPGSPDWEVVLTATPYLDGTLSIAAGNGAFTEVANFLDSGPTDKHFTVTVDQNDKATVRFGNGVSGQIPTGSVVADYKTGGGAAGQVEAGTVTVIEGSFADTFLTPVVPFVNNASASTPATDRAGVEKIRHDAPLSLRVQNRTVSREDYEINAKRVPQVARALMLTSNEDGSIGENQGFLAIVPVGGGLPTQALKDDVLEMVTVTYPNTLTFALVVGDPVYMTVNFRIVVFLRKGSAPATVDASIRTNLVNFFRILNDDDTENTNIDFGFRFVETTGDPEGKLPWSDLFNVVRDTDGVRKVDDGPDSFLVNGAREDLIVGLREFPVLGTVQIYNGETGALLVP